MSSSSRSGPIRGEFVVGGKYKLLQKIGSGSFGEIYKAVNITNGEVSCPLIRIIDQVSPAVNAL